MLSALATALRDPQPGRALLGAQTRARPVMLWPSSASILLAGLRFAQWVVLDARRVGRCECGEGG